jgi:hypothetical protein
MNGVRYNTNQQVTQLRNQDQSAQRQPTSRSVSMAEMFRHGNYCRNGCGEIARRRRVDVTVAIANPSNG